MPLTFDPEFVAALGPVADQMASMPRPAIHDIATRRTAATSMFKSILDAVPEQPTVKQATHTIQSYDGTDIPLLQFSPQCTLDAAQPGPAILFVHGGGMIIGDLPVLAPAIVTHAATTGVQIFAPDYRVAPEHPHPALVEDTYASLKWLQAHASTFNIDPARIAIVGESSGGGVAAGVALMARDRHLSPPLAKQILIYPMLDDRNLTPNPAIEDKALWSTNDNITGWTALLGASVVGSNDSSSTAVSPYAAPARAASLAGLPPTYIDVGELDIFRDEDIAYAARLARENVSVELHVYPGVPHAFEVLGPTTSVARRALENRRIAMTKF